MAYRYRHHPALLLLLLLLVTANRSSAQSPPSPSTSNNNNNNNNPYLTNPNFNPSMAIVIVILISAFFFLGFFSIYVRQCAGDRRSDPSRTSAARITANRSRRNRGLDPTVLASFPTLVYSDVREHKIGKGSLECAVCLSEFEDDETLRLLPKCSHVFHPDCIDAWLAAHVTCPVCRCNLDELPDAVDEALVTDEITVQPPEPAPAATATTTATTTTATTETDQEQVSIEIDPEDQERINNLERFVNMKRARSRARPARFPRSHSTGHSLVLPGENLDRFTLRLPENIRKEIVQRAYMMQRTKSLVAFPTEESSRRGYRATRSIRLGRSDRWGSFLLRTLSTKMTNWGRRTDDDGSTSARRGGGGFFRRGDSVKRADSMKGEGSSARGVRFNPVITPFDCYGGAAKEETDDSQTASTATMMNRV